MSLLEELEGTVRAYIAGDIDRRSLDSWLGQHVQAIHDAHDVELARLDNRCWILLAELGYGHRTEAEVKELLAEMRAGAPEPAAPDRRPA